MEQNKQTKPKPRPPKIFVNAWGIGDLSKVKLDYFLFCFKNSTNLECLQKLKTWPPKYFSYLCP